jgi:hypothetical protein
MAWYVYIAHLFAGALLINSIPHLVNGLSGRRFPSPFASPPGVGASPALVNILWGFTNLVAGYGLLAGIGPFVFGLSLDAGAVGLGALVMACRLANYFGGRNTSPTNLTDRCPYPYGRLSHRADARPLIHPTHDLPRAAICEDAA